MSTRPAPHAAPGRRPGWSLVARSVASALAGLVATLVLSLALGWALFGRRGSWDEGQGEGFVTTVFAIYAAPLGALYWGLAGALEQVTLGAWVGGRARRNVFLVAVSLYLVGLGAGFLVIVGGQ